MSSALALPFDLAPTRKKWNLVIVGGGPAGLAVAIVAAEQGLSAIVLERHEFPPDKACGEGVLPPGVKALKRLGIADRFDRRTPYPFAGIRFIQEDGSASRIANALARTRHPPRDSCRRSGAPSAGAGRDLAPAMLGAWVRPVGERHSRIHLTRQNLRLADRRRRRTSFIAAQSLRT